MSAVDFEKEEKKHNFSDLEDIFENLSTENNLIDQQLLEDYYCDRKLFERDIQKGLLNKELVSLYEKELTKKESNKEKELVFEHPQKVKVLEKLKKRQNFGFIEPILLSLIVGGLGTIYLCYLYLSF